jgi:hypothetical protein
VWEAHVTYGAFVNWEGLILEQNEDNEALHLRDGDVEAAGEEAEMNAGKCGGAAAV